MVRRARRRKARNSQKGISWVGILGVLLALIAVLTIAFLLYLRSDLVRLELDQKTLCDPAKPVDNVVAVLIDTTDQLSARTIRHVERYLDNAIYNFPVNTRIAVYEVSGKSEEVLAPILSICKPSDGSNANSMVSNPLLIKKKFEEKFKLPLNEKLTSIMKNKESNSTPLIESLQSTVVETFLEYPNAASKQIILVSDLLQHSDLYSFYSQKPEYSQFISKAKKTGRGAVNLKGISLHLLVVPTTIPVGSRQDVIKFWSEFMVNHGANPGSTMEPLS